MKTPEFEDGVQVTPAVQLAPPAKVAVHVWVGPSSKPKVVPRVGLILTLTFDAPAAAPTFVIVKTNSLEVVPKATRPK